MSVLGMSTDRGLGTQVSLPGEAINTGIKFNNPGIYYEYPLHEQLYNVFTRTHAHTHTWQS